MYGLLLVGLTTLLAVWLYSEQLFGGNVERSRESGSGDLDITSLSTEGRSDESKVVPIVAWWLPDNVGAVPSGHIPDRPDDADDAVLVELDDGLQHWREGDVLAIVLPQSEETYWPVIERVETVIGNSISYTARTRGNPQVSVVLTVAPDSTFGWVSTRSGSFELTGNSLFAWFAPEAGLREEFAEGQTDMVTHNPLP